MSIGPTLTPDALRSTGSRSGSGWSSQSISPLTSAFTAVAASGMMRHSTRSTSTRWPPAQKLAGSLRGA